MSLLDSLKLVVASWQKDWLQLCWHQLWLRIDEDACEVLRILIVEFRHIDASDVAILLLEDLDGNGCRLHLLAATHAIPQCKFNFELIVRLEHIPFTRSYLDVLVTLLPRLTIFVEMAEINVLQQGLHSSASCVCISPRHFLDA